MMRARWMCGALLCVLTACGLAGGGGGGGGVPRENTAATLTLNDSRFYVDYSNGVIATLPGGDVVLSALLADDKGYNADLAVIRLDSSMRPKWAVRIDERTVPSQVLPGPDGAVFVLAGDSYPGSLRVLRLEGEDGTVERAVEYDLAPGRALVLEDGGLLLAAGNLMRVDASLTPLWAKTIPAVHVVAAGDGFVAAGVPLGMGARMSGIGLTKFSLDGRVAWKSFASPGPAQGHSLAGVRVQPDGSFLVGLGNDSTRSDSVAALSPFVLTTFDASGRLQKMSRAELWQKVSTSTGSTEAPLQFGGGYSLVSMGEDTWMSFAANSGVFGSDVRTHVLARFGADGSFVDARYAGLHAAPGPDGSTFSFSLSGPELTLFQVFPKGAGCVQAPTRAAFVPVEGKTEYTEGASVSVSDVRVVTRSLVRTATPLSVSTASGCAAP
ncbi:hypothetical protein [Archangium violaceum]|uniref:hypothetical protein n=1 Tax=Archangium violaceum TaxID=83451 RepID=UPI0036D934FC